MYIPDDIAFHILEYIPIPCAVGRVSLSFYRSSRMIWDKEVRDTISSFRHLTITEAMERVATKRLGYTITIKEEKKELWCNVLIHPHVCPIVTPIIVIMILDLLYLSSLYISSSSFHII